MLHQSRKHRFPHYTWGYIVLSLFNFPFIVVPSLYVRVYRAGLGVHVFASCSLTIREGISGLRWTAAKGSRFPHYTWGYIGSYGTKDLTLIVPSLYVRVYRLLWVFLHSSCSSLTIREGISLKAFYPKHSRTFPHYTWGYIDFGNLLLLAWFVPSLYVRVYRSFVVLSALWLCSLTIREGISKRNAKKDAKIAFPHYMWGYIGHFRFFQNHSY